MAFDWSFISLFFRQPFEAELPAVEEELEADRIKSQPEQTSEEQHLESLVSQDQESAPQQPSPDSVISAMNKDDPSILNLHEDFPNRQAAFTSTLYENICLAHSLTLVTALSSI